MKGLADVLHEGAIQVLVSLNRIVASARNRNWMQDGFRCNGYAVLCFALSYPCRNGTGC